MIDLKLSKDLENYLETNYIKQDCSTNNSFDLEECYNLDEYFKSQLKDFNNIFRQFIKDYNKKNNTKDSDIYKKAHISKELFNKIINQKTKPNKASILSLAIALELKADKLNDLLNSAGFSLTNTDKFDLVIKFCIEKGIYDIMTINEILYKYNLKLLGSSTNTKK